MNIDKSQVPAELESFSGEFQLGSFTVEYYTHWDLDVRCDVIVNDRTVAVSFPIIHGDHSWKRGGEGAKASHNGEPLWDPAKPGKVRTAYKQELPTAVVMQAISAACNQFLAAVNPPENWLDDLFYSRCLRDIQCQADIARQGYEHLMQQAQKQHAVIGLVLQKEPAARIALFHKYGEILCQSEISGLLDRGEKKLRAELYQELGLE